MPDFFGKSHIVELENKLEHLKMNFEYEQTVLTKIVTSLKNIEKSCQKSIDSFNGLNNNFNDFQESSFFVNNKQKEYKETLKGFT